MHSMDAVVCNEATGVYVAANAADEARYQEGLGRCVVRIPTGEKGPRDKGWNKSRELPENLAAYFDDGHQNIGLQLGEPSEWIADVDLDCPEAVELADQYLPPTDCVTGREGRERSHWWYYCEGAETCRLNDPVDGSTIVELRSTGQQTVIGPSTHPDGGQYDLLRGEPASVPYEELRERVEALHCAVCVLRGHDVANEPTEFPAASGASTLGTAELKPGEDYNRRSDQNSILPLLLKHGWSVEGRSDHGLRLTRPGKDGGNSATLYPDGTFYLFSSSTPLEDQKGLSPFHVFATYEHGGDHSAAARALSALGFGDSTAQPPVDLSALIAKPGTGTDGASLSNGLGFEVRDWCPDDSGITGGNPADSFPEHLLSVPGFIGEYLEYALSTAYAQQPALTLFGGICLQAALAARKINDPYDNQTSLYVLAMAESGTGKDHPRRLNREILSLAGVKIEGPEDLASDSGLLSVLAENPGALLQFDEIGRLLKVASGAGTKVPHLYSIQTQLLRLYSSVGSVFSGKAYADTKRNREIFMPCPVIYGTTVPASFWDSLSSESIGDGFLARLIPVVGIDRPIRDRVKSKPVPESLVRHAAAWDTFSPGGNLSRLHPSPLEVEYTPEADELADHWTQNWQDRADRAGEWRPIWVRAAEKAGRLALVYAASRGVDDLRIDADAVRWASEVVNWSTELFESRGSDCIADSDFGRALNVIEETLKRYKGRRLKSQVLNHRRIRQLPPRITKDLELRLMETGRIRLGVGPKGGEMWILTEAVAE